MSCHDGYDLPEHYLVIGNTQEHPNKIEDVLSSRASTEVTIPNSGKNLQCPIQTFDIFLHCRCVEFIEIADSEKTFARHPGVGIEVI